MPITEQARTSDKHGPFVAYERVGDKIRQNKICAKLEKLWNFQAKDNGEKAVIDYSCFRDGELIAIMEIKSRFCQVDDYSTYMCTTKDIDEGLALSKEFGVPFLLVVKWDDFFAYVKITRNDYPSRPSGQKNRNDPNDYMAMCYLIPTSEFVEIKHG
jgi:hypothetical protein